MSMASWSCHKQLPGGKGVTTASSKIDNVPGLQKERFPKVLSKTRDVGKGMV